MAQLTKEEICKEFFNNIDNKDENNKIINPKTNRKIKINGSVFKILKKECSDFEKEIFKKDENKSKKKSKSKSKTKVVKIDNKILDLAKKWEKNKKIIKNNKVINPKTGRYIKINSKTYKNLEKEFSLQLKMENLNNDILDVDFKDDIKKSMSNDLKKSIIEGPTKPKLILPQIKKMKTPPLPENISLSRMTPPDSIEKQDIGIKIDILNQEEKENELKEITEKLSELDLDKEDSKKISGVIERINNLDLESDDEVEEVKEDNELNELIKKVKNNELDKSQLDNILKTYDMPTQKEYMKQVLIVYLEKLI